MEIFSIILIFIFLTIVFVSVAFVLNKIQGVGFFKPEGDKNKERIIQEITKNTDSRFTFKKIKDFFKRAYNPKIKKIIIFFIVISIGATLALTISQKSTIDNKITNKKETLDKKNEAIRLRNSLNLGRCELDKKKMDTNLFRDLLDFDCSLTEIPLINYEQEKELTKLQFIRNKSFIGLFFNNMFVGEYSFYGTLVTYGAILFILLVPSIIIFLKFLFRIIYSKLKMGYGECRKMSSFQRYSLILFFAIFLSLMTISLILLL